MKKAISLILLASLMCLPAVSKLRAEGEGGAKVTIKVATMIPRTQEIAIQEKMYNQRLAEMTNGRLQFKTYYGGTAGDDNTVMRKLRTGQIDAAPLGTDIIAPLVKQCTILMSPQTFFNYKQVDAVREALSPEFNQEAYGNGFKIMGWWDAGRVRIYGQQPIRTFEDLRKVRPWLYPPSTLLKEFYKMIKVTGIPLDLPEVYGALSTNMIDTVWISSVLGAAFRWTSNAKYVSARPVNVIQGAFILRRATWESLSPEDQKALETVVSEQTTKTLAQFRGDDDRTYTRITSRGVTPVEFANVPEWEAAGEKLRKMLVGRLYTKELLARVESITAKYPGN